MSTRDPYDRLPYTDHAYAESHPDRLATVARLAGWVPPALGRARVLELGCGRGGNLLPMASSLPGATLVGVDRSERQIDEARALAAAAGVRNVRFERADVTSFVPTEDYDFVVCHGLASWISPATRRALLFGAAHALAPGGIAYVSFNVLPGWYDRLAARAFLRAFPSDGPRASLAWLRDAVSPELGDYRRRLDAIISRLQETDLAYATHEYLADEHHPLFVRDLLGEASEVGLAYLGDAIPAETSLALLPEAVRERAASLGTVEAQQLVDFVRNTAFRRALLVRDRDAQARRFRWRPELHADALGSLRVSSRLRPHAPEAPAARSERFDGPDQSAQIDAPLLRRTLHALARIAPRSVPWPDLAQGLDPTSVETLRADLLDLVVATGAVDLHAHEPPLGDARSPRPRACPVARWHAAHGGPITNAWHQEVRLDDPLLREVLALLDGRPVDAVAAALAGSAAVGALGDGDRAALVEASLRALASAALLLA